MKKVIFAVAVLTCLAMTGTVQAYTWNQPSTWTGNSSDQWTNAGNWDNGKPGQPWRAPFDGDGNKWWADTDGYINPGDEINGAGEISITGNSNPSEIFQSGGDVALGSVNLQMTFWNQSAGTLDMGTLYISRNGGFQNGLGRLGSGLLLSGTASTTLTNLLMSLDGNPATVKQTGSSAVTVDDALTLVSGGGGSAFYSVGGGTTLDVDLDGSSSGITVNSDGVLVAVGTVTTSSLTINGTGLVKVAGSTLILLGDQQSAMQAYVDGGQIVGAGPDPAVVTLVDGNTHVTPEPATMCLLAIGGLAVLRRRRK